MSDLLEMLPPLDRSGKLLKLGDRAQLAFKGATVKITRVVPAPTAYRRHKVVVEFETGGTVTIHPCHLEKIDE